MIRAKQGEDAGTCQYFAAMVPARFNDPSTPPEMAALAKRVGNALDVVINALQTLDGKPGQVSHAWHFSKTSGWYLTYDRGNKRLFYLFPKDGDLLLKLVFNETGVQTIRSSDLPSPVLDKLATAKIHAEGTVLEFAAPEIHATLLATLLRIKIASMR